MRWLVALWLALLTVVSTVSAQQQPNVATLPVDYGGAVLFRSIDVDESGAQIKGSRGNLYGWYIFNAANATRYFKFFNDPLADVQVGVDTPVLTIPLAAGAAANVPWPQGALFSRGLTIACTTGIADNNTGAPGANECVANILYK